MIKLKGAVSLTAFAVAAAGTLWSTAAFADPLALFDTLFRPNTAFDEALRDRSSGATGSVSLHRAPVIDEGTAGSTDVPANLRRQVVSYPTAEPAGTVVIDTPHTYLYLVLGGGKAMRYGIGVGREGFTWSGVQTVSRKQEWPDWHPPAAMIGRQPYLPRFMAGGPGNPLGARAMHIGGTDYRIHGTNDPSSIGKFMSSGCIRLTNPDVEDLFSRVKVGAKVIVLPKTAAPTREASRPVTSQVASYAPAEQTAAARAWNGVRPN